MSEQAYLDRMQDLIDAYALDQVTREEFIRRVSDLNGDWYDAVIEAQLVDEQRAAS